MYIGGRLFKQWIQEHPSCLMHEGPFLPILAWWPTKNPCSSWYLPAQHHQGKPYERMKSKHTHQSHIHPNQTYIWRRLGGSSIRILNFCNERKGHVSCQIVIYTCSQLTFNRLGSPFSTLTRYNCFISFSKRLGRPGYMVEPPDNTMCLYKSARISISADWIVSNKSSTCDIVNMLYRHVLLLIFLPAMPLPSTSTRCGWNKHSGASNRSEPTLITRPSGS